MTQIPWLENKRDSSGQLWFPSTDTALDDPNGLLAAGGDLSTERLLRAYSLGIFPWYEQGQPILWWSPSPRTIVYPNSVHISRSLAKELRRARFEIRADSAFESVIRACAGSRNYTDSTWITEDMIQAYLQLHRLGVAHSIETWLDGNLVGGLYGIALGRVFFGESMFSRVSNASKVAFAQLARQLQRWDFAAIDCQVASDHLFSLGAEEIDRTQWQALLRYTESEPAEKSPNWNRVFKQQRETPDKPAP